MTNCTYLKQKLNRTLECKKQNKIINIRECNGCKYREYTTSCQQLNQYRQKLPKMTIKKRTYKQAKKEKNRKSVFTNDLEHCIICGKKKEHLHEVFFGRNRLNSIKYNLVIPLCFDCHSEMHRNKEWQLYWHIRGQKYFEKYIGDREKFISVFGRNYLKKI